MTKPEPPEWFMFSYLVVLAGCFAVTGALGVNYSKVKDQLADVRVEASDKRRERDTCLQLYDDSQKKLKNFDESCEGYNCKTVFSNEVAGVISTTYLAHDITDVAVTIDFCTHDDRVNLGKQYPGAKLMEFGTDDRTDKGGLPNFLVRCSWLIPSGAWCLKGM